MLLSLVMEKPNNPFRCVRSSRKVQVCALVGTCPGVVFSCVRGRVGGGRGGGERGCLLQVLSTKVKGHVSPPYIGSYAPHQPYIL